MYIFEEREGGVGRARREREREREREGEGGRGRERRTKKKKEKKKQCIPWRKWEQQKNNITIKNIIMKLYMHIYVYSIRYIYVYDIKREKERGGKEGRRRADACVSSHKPSPLSLSLPPPQPILRLPCSVNCLRPSACV